MKIVKDYVNFEKLTGGKFQYYTVSLTATFATEQEAEVFVRDLEQMKKILEQSK